MFGPDFCGEVNRIHVIIPHYNPVSNSWEEKKLVGGPQAVIDSLTHLYTLIIRKDGSMEILVDQINKFTGSLFMDFRPPFTTPAVGYVMGHDYLSTSLAYFSMNFGLIRTL